ncbi:MAG: DnaJ domain-containing protein, partial [Pseudomonadota bacterium]
LSDAEVLDFAVEASGDAESAQLLEAYLDRRMPSWRDDAQPNAGAGQASPAQSGAMTEQEAYQILGLEPSATLAEIRKAHRRLMQSVHPDVGGSEFLAQRINEAKDFLLTLHKTRS